MKAKLNSRIEYASGYINSMMQYLARKVDDAELIERVFGYGESNAVVFWEGHYYLATVNA